MASEGKLGVALFGLGRAGTIHLGNIIKSYRTELRYIIDLDTEKAREATEKFFLTSTKVLKPDDAKVVYEDKQVDAVVVCTPTFAHEEIVRGALAHGKAVFCEKPISERPEGIRECYEAAEKAGKPLLCSFNRRWDPSVRGVRDKVRNGKIGKIHSVKTCARDHPLPTVDYLRISGGMFHDCAVHDIDMVCWILGEYPERVYTEAHAHDSNIKNLNDVDSVAIVMKFSNGILAMIDLSRHACYGYDQRVEVYGSEGMLISENQYPGGIEAYFKDGVQLGRIQHSFPQRYAESYVAALEHFFDVVQGKAEIEVSKLDTIRIGQLASACEESYRKQTSILLADYFNKA